MQKLHKFKTSDITKQFFATVQNKLHFAISGQTAAEIVVERIDSRKKNLGLTNFRGLKPTKEELTQLNALVEQYLIFATEQARRRIPMTMNDWIEKLHGFLTINLDEITLSYSSLISLSSVNFYMHLFYSFF